MICISSINLKRMEYLSQVEVDFEKVRKFLDESIEDLNNGNYVYVCKGYSGDNSGGKYDRVIQEHAEQIVNKLSSLGYSCITNHGHGCYDWKFYKSVKL